MYVKNSFCNTTRSVLSLVCSIAIQAAIVRNSVLNLSELSDVLVLTHSCWLNALICMRHLMHGGYFKLGSPKVIVMLH